MNDNTIHERLIKCFGPIQGEMAWQQTSQLSEEIREQLMSQDPNRPPNPFEVQQMTAAFNAGGLSTMGDTQHTIEEGPINVKLAKSIALQQVNASGSASSVFTVDGEAARYAMSEANLWLDTIYEFSPVPGDPDVLTRAGRVESIIDQWAKFAAPVAESMNDALASVVSERLDGTFSDDEIAGMFAGPVSTPIPDGMKDPIQLMKLLGNMSSAMRLGYAAGNLSHEVHGSLDQSIALLKNPAGGLTVQNATEYAKMLSGEASAAEADTVDTSTDSANPFSTPTGVSANPTGPTLTDNSDTPATDGIAQIFGSDASADTVGATAFEVALSGFETTEKTPESGVPSFLIPQEMVHARLYVLVPWLVLRFETLTGKCIRDVSIDLNAMEKRLCDAMSMDSESISGAVNFTKVGISDTPEQREVLASLESLPIMVEG